MHESLHASDSVFAVFPSASSDPAVTQGGGEAHTGLCCELRVTGCTPAPVNTLPPCRKSSRRWFTRCSPEPSAVPLVPYVYTWKGAAFLDPVFSRGATKGGRLYERLSGFGCQGRVMIGHGMLALFSMQLLWS